MRGRGPVSYTHLDVYKRQQYGPWRDPSVNGFPRIEMFPDSARLPVLGGIHIGWIFAILATCLLYTSRGV